MFLETAFIVFPLSHKYGKLCKLQPGESGILHGVHFAEACGGIYSGHLLSVV